LLLFTTSDFFFFDSVVVRCSFRLLWCVAALVSLRWVVVASVRYSVSPFLCTFGGFSFVLVLRVVVLVFVVLFVDCYRATCAVGAVLFARSFRHALSGFARVHCVCLGFRGLFSSVRCVWLPATFLVGVSAVATLFRWLDLLPLFCYLCVFSLILPFVSCSCSWLPLFHVGCLRCVYRFKRYLRCAWVVGSLRSCLLISLIQRNGTVLRFLVLHSFLRCSFGFGIVPGLISFILFDYVVVIPGSRLFSVLVPFWLVLERSAIACCSRFVVVG